MRHQFHSQQVTQPQYELRATETSVSLREPGSQRAALFRFALPSSAESQSSVNGCGLFPKLSPATVVFLQQVSVSCFSRIPRSTSLMGRCGKSKTTKNKNSTSKKDKNKIEKIIKNINNEATSTTKMNDSSPSMEVDATATTSLVQTYSNKRLSDKTVATFTVKDVKEVATKVNEGLDIIKQILETHVNLYKDAPVEQQRNAMDKLVSSNAFTCYTQAIADAAYTNKKLADIVENVRPTSHSEIATEEDITFELRISPLKEVNPSLNVKHIFAQATEKLRIQVFDYVERAGVGLFKFKKKVHATLAMDVIKTHKVNGTPITDHYAITLIPLSVCSVKMIKAKKQVLIDNYLWINNKLEIQQELMQRTLVKRNCDWFESETDIKHASISHLPNEECIIQIFVSQQAFDKMLSTGKNAIKIDVGNCITVQTYINVNVQMCLKCGEFDHILSRCTNKSKCKFCGNEHMSSECPTPATPKCHRCTSFNQQNSEQRDTNHHSQHQNCPEVKQQRELTLAQMRIKAFKRLNNVN